MPPELDSPQPIKSLPSDHNIAIDILKGLMIMLVIIDHAIPTAVRAQWGHSLWERISIPVFLMIMGINTAHSFKKNGVPDSFRDLMLYYKRKLIRYLLPFAVLYVISTITGLIINGSFEMLLQNQFDGHWEREMLWDFILPFYGPGNWFIPVIFQAAILIPLLYWLYKKSPDIVLGLSVLWEIMIQDVVWTLFGHWTAWWPDVPLGRTILQMSALFYLNAIVIGFWLEDHLYLGSPPVIIPSEKQSSLVETTPESPLTAIDENPANPSQNLSTGPSKLPWHFYVVLLSVILVLAVFLQPWMALVTSSSFSITFIILCVFLVIGLYTYRPLDEFLRLGTTTLIFVIGLSYAFALYYQISGIDFINWTVEARSELYFLAVGIFIIPYLLNIFYSPTNKNWFLWILGIMSGSYLAVYQYDGFRFFQITGDYHFLVYPWSALIILVFVTMIPKNSTFVLFRGFAYVGKATYHILLTQIFAYGLIVARYGVHYFEGALMAEYLGPSGSYNLTVWLYVIIMWLICIPIGIVWHLLEKKFLAWTRERRTGKKSPVKISA
ncbi:MAG: acyltransferase family protein [Promethearchaeota archaeon]